jgi:ATP:corrinoid adenosyltransferase
MESRGLITIRTCRGKGKTTGATGLAFRALGRGLPVCVM